MSDEATFLKAIRENPADDTRRLAYADWLDEQNDPRAEFIRLRQQYAELTARINELASGLAPAWLAAVGGPQLEPEDITLRSGRPLLLRELRQLNFYEGLLEGVPSSERNREDVERLVAQERERWWGGTPYLIEPVERPAKPDPDRPFADEPRGMLPTITCVGRFLSFDAAKDPERHASELTVIWFQDEFAFPIDPAVREQIRAIEWEKHATDFDW
jgi:uncharacterized protein (TIGR02996 family)